MRKVFILFLLIQLTGSFCYAQRDQKIDSLLTVLQRQGTDTNRVNTLNELCKRSLRLNNMPEAKKWVAQSLSLAEKIGFRNGIYNAFNSFGNIATQQGNINYGQGNYVAALPFYLEAQKIFEKNKNKTGIGNSLCNIGKVHWIQRRFPVAMKKFTEGLVIFKETNNKNGMAGALNNIGLVYENQGFYKDALKYYYDAIALYGETGNKWAMIDRYFNIGFLYEDQGNYEEALKNHQAALRISQEIGTEQGIAASNSNIGGVHINSGKYQEALKSYQIAYDIYSKIGNEEGVAILSNNLGEVYIDLKEYKRAGEYLEKALRLSNEMELLENTQKTYELMATLDSATGNFNSALRNHKLYIQARDSLRGQETSEKIMKTQLQFDFDKKTDSMGYVQALTSERLNRQTLLASQSRQSLLLREKELALLANEKALQQLQMAKDSTVFAAHKIEADNRIAELAVLNKQKEIQDLELNKQRQLKKYLLVGIGLLLVLAYFVYRNYRSRQQLKLQLIRNKIASDLHDDIGSTLSSISIFSQMAQKESKEIDPLLESIGENSRKMLDAMADIVWTINPENDQFEKIILRMRSFAFELLGAKKIEFEFKEEQGVSEMKLPMQVRKNLYLIFKEAVNNMVKYSGADKAHFALKEEKKKLTMLIRDNGKGFDILHAPEGNGLRNMQKRAEEIGASLVIDSKLGAGTTIKLNLAV